MKEIEATEGTDYKTLTLDIDYYQSFLDDADIPDDKKQELIETLWNIVVQFVDMGYGIHPLQQANNNADTALHSSITTMIANAVNEESETPQQTISEGNEV
ncbi:MAG: hypothetical protein JJ964_13510 [Rhizobiales bacterium]|nr:hypothetical protein [Hyphomicrobiales bacterium]